MKSMIVLILAACAVGCGKPDAGGGEPPAKRITISPAARDLYAKRCVPCHGEFGKGDGPGAATANPKPRDYQDLAWQKSVKDEDIKKTILYGGAAVGKSATMPPNPDLEGKPELDGLVGVVREFAKFGK